MQYTVTPLHYVFNYPKLFPTVRQAAWLVGGDGLLPLEGGRTCTSLQHVAGAKRVRMGRSCTASAWLLCTLAGGHP